jgi:hypothetical protein
MTDLYSDVGSAPQAEVACPDNAVACPPNHAVAEVPALSTVWKTASW